MEFSSDQMLSHGEVSISPYSLRYIYITPPEQVVFFPVVYNTSWNVSLTKTDEIYVHGAPTIITVYNLSKSMAVDGYGTLKISSYNFQCLRLKRTLTSPLPGDIEFWYITREGALLIISTVNSQSDTGTVQINSMGLFVGGSLVGVQNTSYRPTDFSLSQNYPNPFNPSTTISYQLSVSNKVCLQVFDLLGREVVTLVNMTEQTGRHTVHWNAEAMPSGIYFYRLQSGTFIETKKIVLLK
jgi:hypothetical protein